MPSTRRSQSFDSSLTAGGIGETYEPDPISRSEEGPAYARRVDALSTHPEESAAPPTTYSENFKKHFESQ